MAVPTPPANPQPQYTPPKTGFIALLPRNCVPYAELARIDKPTACLYLYFPCVFGTLLAASLSKPTIPPPQLLHVNLIFLFGCYLVRCAGCTWNDIVDQDLDRKVSRTRLRPLARGAVSTSKAILFTTSQVMTGLLVLVSTLPKPCLYYSVPSILLTGIYPFAKRFTYYPQLILGCVFSWGIIIAFPALEMDLLTLPALQSPAICLFLSCIAWTMLYDTIYAAQDIEDDKVAGIRSPVVRHQGQTRTLLVGSAVVQVAFLCSTGVAMEASALYFVITCCGTALIVGVMIKKIDLDSPGDCLWWFQNGCFYVGVMVGGGLVVEYMGRRNHLAGYTSWSLSRTRGR